MEKLILTTREDGSIPDLTEVLGITKERVTEIGTECEIIFRTKSKEGEPPQTFSGKLSAIVEVCENMNEAVWALFNFGVNIGMLEEAKKRSPKVLHVGGIDALNELLGEVAKKDAGIIPSKND